jgi:ubiquinone/menaquinone biosynthesis C-methylase UbiE
VITKGDIIELFFKLKQRGIEYIFSKFSFNKNTRIKNTFNQLNVEASNYWIIPEIKEHWNTIISNNPKMEYADYVVDKYLKNDTNLKILSLGCGAGSHEIKFAKHSNFSEITGIDLAPKLIGEANKNAQQNNFKNLKYEVANIYDCYFDDSIFDVILFHSSLHHFKNLEKLLGEIIKKTLKENGLLIIHEYVGPDRIQWTKDQLSEVNSLLSILPDKYKKRFKSNTIKRKAFRSGKLRMIISDPSEAIESSAILSTIHNHYKIEEEIFLGGNIVMPLFKDIAHNFIDNSAETKRILQHVFEKEKIFIKTHQSDFVFGVYRNG